MSEADITYLVCLVCTLVGMYVGFRTGRTWKD